MTQVPAKVRDATASDLSAITAIYNDAILTTTATFDTQPKSDAEQAEWFSHHVGRYPVIVAEAGGDVVGWASLSPWSDRLAYEDTAENSLYVRADLRGLGIGRLLLEALMKRARDSGLHTVVARIAEGNPSSVALHEHAGFRPIGVMREVGRKFGRRLDVALMQAVFPEAPPS